ncbi:MAG: OmpH family outer membrane protein [Planctomycetota bacterium]|nr:OmpH family outer membrane protein [Planctomycetota bacterium]
MPIRLKLVAVALACGASAALLLTAWQPQAVAQAQSPSKPSIAVLDLFSVGYELSLSSRYAEDDAQFKKDYLAAVTPLRDQLKELTDRARALDDNQGPNEENPERERLYEQYSDLSEKLEEKDSELRDEYYRRFAARLREAFDKVTEAAEEVAREEGYQYVLASSDYAATTRLARLRDARSKQMNVDLGPGDDEDGPDDSDTKPTGDDLYRDAFDAMRYRTVAVAPADTRIDDLVRDRLGLPVAP